MKKSANPVAIWAAMISVYVAWGSTYLAISFAIKSIPPFLMAGFRFLIAGSLLYAWRRLSGDAAPTRIHWRSAAVVGLLLLLGGNGGVVWAEQKVPSGIAALMVGSSPLWMVLIDWLRGNREHKPTWLTGAGVLVGFLGIAVLVGPAELVGAHGGIDLVGGGVLTLAAFLWAAGSLYSRSASLPASPLLGTGLEMLCGGLGLVALGTLTGEWGQLNLAAITLPSLLGLGYLVIFGSLVGFSSYTWLLRNAPTGLVSTYAYVNPVVAIFAGNLLAQEPLTPRVLLATAVIVGAVALITLNRSNGVRKDMKTAQEKVPVPTGDD
jgi:drug/metabolite transporter (DMT)-like permease